MKGSAKATDILSKISSSTKLGDLRLIAKEIKKDHDLAIELWTTAEFLPRQLAILVMDKKKLSQEVIDLLVKDIETHKLSEQTQLIDWLMANQLTKDKATIAMMESWQNSDFALQRRIYYYYQARLRWMGNTPPPNTEQLLVAIEAGLENEKPEVQWAMNFAAGQIGIRQPEYRSRCVSLGERTGLYKGDMVSRGCTPNYLPEFIAIEVGKLKK